jgi:hypothetical protein
MYFMGREEDSIGGHLFSLGITETILLYIIPYPLIMNSLLNSPRWIVIVLIICIATLCRSIVPNAIKNENIYLFHREPASHQLRFIGITFCELGEFDAQNMICAQQTNVTSYHLQPYRVLEYQDFIAQADSVLFHVTEVIQFMVVDSKNNTWYIAQNRSLTSLSQISEYEAIRSQLSAVCYMDESMNLSIDYKVFFSYIAMGFTLLTIPLTNVAMGCSIKMIWCSGRPKRNEALFSTPSSSHGVGHRILHSSSLRPSKHQNQYRFDDCDTNFNYGSLEYLYCQYHDSRQFDFNSP